MLRLDKNRKEHSDMTRKIFIPIINFFGFLALICLSLPIVAQDEISDTQVQKLLQVKIRTVETLAYHPKLIEAVNEQNAQTLSPDTIRQRDEEWSSSQELTPFKRSLQISKAGKVLQRLVETNPSFNEAFITDNQGANVAAFPATSDYWQGDEEKWQNAFNNGDGKTFIGPLERDDSTQTVAVQISAPILDKKDTIGVLIVGVTLSYLESRQE
jgi:hypothetical protein